jgi:PIN domain nuclease of toxin-antitoxin system
VRLLLDTYILLWFDLMLIAQAQREGHTIVTADAIIRRYAVALL